MPVGAHQIGQHLGVAGIGLRARDVVAVAIAGHRQRVDRVHLIAGRDQRLDPQAAIGLDPDHDLAGFLGVSATSSWNARIPSSPSGSRRAASRARLVHQMDVVMVLCPVVSDEDQCDRLLVNVVEPVRAEGHPAAT